MFENAGFSHPLDEELFHEWLEEGRESKISYNYMLIVWDDFENEYQPAYLENREDIENYRQISSRVSLIAAYDLFSESRVF